MITHIGVAVLYVSDQQESVDFYVEKLGFTKTTDAEMSEGTRWIEVTPPNGQTAIAIHDAAAFGKQPGEGAYLTFTCDDIQATVDGLRNAGVTVTDPTEEPWGIYAHIDGPDGHRIQIHQK
ncbi:lactoylglutathione lyase [Planobispora rosea]|uniref:Lactoylglutathione lyase n=1 Tax=Planobispora rosea TaxID=35762 RepID=A0A8J3S1W3_PLARO|nr:VOC family protein [Planobispora rosea]GGS62164.1 lactoylglutathione lyase [Planobispora rosea]GIH84366.1 lactoylglutathione lyase [Planobispora rosea]